MPSLPFRRMFLALLLFAACAPALADTPVSRIRIQVNDQAGQPVRAGIKLELFAEVTASNTYPKSTSDGFNTLVDTSSQPTSKTGSGTGASPPPPGLDLTANPNGKPLQPGIYRVTVTTGKTPRQKSATTVVYIGTGSSPTIAFGLSDLMLMDAGVIAVSGAQTAFRNRDKSLYEKNKTAARADLTDQAETISDLDKAIEAYRKANSIPHFRSTRALRRAINAGGSSADLPVNKDKIAHLRNYDHLLVYRNKLQANLDKARRAFLTIPDWPADQLPPDATRPRTSSVVPGPNETVAERSGKSDLLRPRDVSGYVEFNRQGANSRIGGAGENTGITGFTGAISVRAYEDIFGQVNLGYTHLERSFGNVDLGFDTLSVGFNPFYRNERFKVGFEFSYNFTEFEVNGTSLDQESFQIGGKTEIYINPHITAYGRGGIWELDSQTQWLSGGFGQFAITGYLLDGNLAIKPNGGFTNFESMSGIHFCYREWGADVECLPAWRVPISVNVGVHKTEQDRVSGGFKSTIEKTVVSGGFTYYLGAPGGANNDDASLRDWHRKGTSMSKNDVLIRALTHY